MSIESKLAIDLLAESKISKHQRRYIAVQRYIKAFGLLPHYTQIIRELPKEKALLEHIVLSDPFSEEISILEKSLELDPDNPEIINSLDKLYDEAYRLNSNN